MMDSKTHEAGLMACLYGGLTAALLAATLWFAYWSLQ